MGGKSGKSVTVGYWYKIAFHMGLGVGPIDAFLEFRGGDKTAWNGELTSTGTIHVDAENLWGGKKDQGGIVGDLDVLFGDADQQPSSYMASTFGPQIPAWRGLASVLFKGGKYGAMNPYPQKAAYKIRKIASGWDNDDCWYPSSAEIPMGLSGSVANASDINWRYIITSKSDNTNYSSVSFDDSSWAVGTAPFASKPASGGYDPSSHGFSNNPSVVVPVGKRLWTRAAISIVDVPSSDVEFEAWVDNNASLYINGSHVLTVGGHYGGYYIGTIPAGSFEEGLNIIAVDSWDNESEGDDSGNWFWSDWRFNGLSMPDGSLLGMNPAHILYYSLTNSDMGRVPVAQINDASFKAAADWYFAQGFGLCTAYDPSQESVADFQARICKVAGCSISRSPVDGLWYIDIANGEYDIDSLDILTDDDVLDFSEQPTVLDSAVNSVSVTYFDPQIKDNVVAPPVQAMGLIDAFGTISQSTEYLEIPTGALALRVAERDLRAIVTPLRGFTLTTTRACWAWRPGQYKRLQLPKRGIADMVVIVGDVQRGTLRSGAMRIVLTQDVYSLPATTFVSMDPAVDPNAPQPPMPITAQAAFEAPYIDVVSALSRADLAALPADAGYLQAVAADPATSRGYELFTSPDGSTWTDVAAGDWCPAATTSDAHGYLDTVIGIAAFSRLDEIEIGAAALWDAEIVRVDAIDATASTITIARGCADTVPSTHTAGSRLWFWQGNTPIDTTEYTAGETLHVKLLTETGTSKLDLIAANDMPVFFAGRAALPYPPGNLKINGVSYPTAIKGALALSWAHRDRITQADQLIDTTQASIGPEPGTTYNLRLYGEANTLLRTETGLTVTSYTWSTEQADSGLTIPGAVSNAYSPAMLALSPSGLYMMEETTGTQMTDSSGNANHGAYVGTGLPSSPALVTEGSLSLAASDALYATAPGAVASALSGFSIVLWVQWSHASNTVVCERNGNAGYSVQTYSASEGYAGSIGVTSTIGGVANIYLVSSIALDDGSPHCVEIVFGATAAASYLYVDGVDRTLRPNGNASPTYGSSTIWYLGSRAGVVGFNGRLDGVAFIPSALTSTQAADINAAGRAAVSRLNGRVRAELEAVRGGLVSYQKHNITVDRAGYGYQYGNYYGGI